MSVHHPSTSKIPGGMPAMKSEKLVKDVTALNQLQLLEIKEREEKLLANKSRINRLPDKGKRIQEFYDKIVQELERRCNIDEAAKLLSEMNIASKGERVLNKMEWSNGKISGPEPDPLDDVLDSDDECELDPLRVIAQRQMHERRVKVLKPEPTLITAQDLEEIKSFSANSSDSGLFTETGNSDVSEDKLPAIEAELITVDVAAKPSLKTKLKELVDKSPNDKQENPSWHNSSLVSNGDVDKHVLYVVDKTEVQVQPQREKFKPYKTTITNVHDPAKERCRKMGPKWEVTAATPPLIQHTATQSLSLLDSIDIQRQYLDKMKDLREQQAAERLAAKVERQKLKAPDPDEAKAKPSFTTYRNPTSVCHIEGDRQHVEYEEIHDPTDIEPRAGVNFTIAE